MKNLTPQHMRCGPFNCPSIHKLDDGKLLIVGKYARQQDMDACGARADLQEVGVIISPDLLADVEREWRTIDSAPKDGTEILLWYTPGRHPGSDGTAINDGGAIQGWYFSSPKQTDDGWETVIGFIGDPTHWMPLPSPPKPLNEREQG